MIRQALLAAIVLAAGLGERASATTALQIWVDIDGSAYLQNTTAGPLSFGGYQIASESDGLNPAGWKSIADYVAGGEIAEVIAALGPGGLTFGEANPTAAALAELNLGGVATLQGGAKFAIGKPFKNPENAERDIFFAKIEISGGICSCAFDIVYAPEPTTFLLGALAGIGLVAMRRCKPARSLRPL